MNKDAVEQRKKDFKALGLAFVSVSPVLSGEEYENFAASFSKELKSDFQELERAQCESEERAKEHWVF